MNKQLFTTFILAISFFCNVQASSSFTQDSIKTEISGNKSITTIYVTASQAVDIPLGFWLMGVKHCDNTYSSYAIKINGQSQTGYLQTSKGDWQYICPTGQTTFSLASGSNQIQIEGTLSDIPNIGYVQRHVPDPPFPQNPPYYNNNPDYCYGLLKQHRYANSPYEIAYPTEAVIDYNKDYHYSTATNDTLYPPTYFTAHLSKETFYTFYRKEYYSAGQTVTFQTDTIGV